MNELLEDLPVSWQWVALLAIGVPVLLVILNELLFSLVRKGSPIAPTARWTRNWVIPSIAVAAFLRWMLGLPATSLWARIAETACWISIAIAVLSFVNGVVFESARPGSWQQRVPRLLRDLVKVLLVALAGAIVYSTVWGQDIGGAMAALGVSSIVVGLALQEPLGNLFSGLMLLSERPFEIGDRIGVGDVAGVVKQMNWRSVHLDGKGGVTQVFPNSMLNQQMITNYSVPAPIRMEMIELRFSFNDPPNQVRDALTELAASVDGVLEDPAPIASTVGYGDFSVNYQLIYRTPQKLRWKVRNEIMTRIWYMARRHGFTIPYPVDVCVNYDEAGAFAKPGTSPVEDLQQFPRIPPVADGGLGAGVRKLAFGKGETVFEEGDDIEGTFLVVSGSVSLRAVNDGDGVEIGAVRPGEFFGEAAMYGRHAAEVRAIATQDTELLVLPPETIRALFESSPRLARDAGQSMDVRRKALQSARNALRRR